MTKPRPPRHTIPHPDDVWRPGEKARMMRRLLQKLMERRTPEMQEEFRRHRAAELAARRSQAGRKTG